MNTTAELPTIAAPQLNATQRSIESRVETSIPGIFLSIITTHTAKSYWSRLDRIQIKDGILTMKIDRARFTDLPPVAQRKVAAARYSARNLEASHAAFAPLVEAQLAEALAWAERF